MNNPFPSVRVEQTITISLNWSQHFTGTGRTLKEARAELMCDILSKARNDNQVRRAQAALDYGAAGAVSE